MNRSRWGSVARRLGAVVAALAVASVGVIVVPSSTSPAHAALITDGFDPGYIISDELFYDGDGMSVTEIQNFLDARVTRCTLGDPGREKGKSTEWNGPTFLAQECLKDARFDTTTRASDGYCDAYRGAQNETAAQIIAKVAKACGISPQVILITLEKEQSLVTDDWPTVKMFDIAMGFACPDTGPNNTANCDAAYFGFYNQVYWGARQFQVYKANPNRYNYKAHQNNSILYHPNQSCGRSTVYIENWATAALYIYTPYRPNASALAAGWGTGDSCASYGNRNFYNFYKSWFGQPNVKHNVYSAFVDRASSFKWIPSSDPVVGNGGVYQEFAGGETNGGVIFLPNGGIVSHMTSSSPLLKAHRAAGFVTGSWGWPKGPSTNYGPGQNVKQFDGGTVVESDGVRAVLIDPQLLAYWNSSGGFNGSLGAPMSSAQKASGTVEQTFKKGTVLRDSSGTVRTIDSTFLAEWKAGGGVSNPLGTPTGNATTVSANGGGKVYPLTKGAMYSYDGKVTTLPSGTILTAYNKAGGASGTWGWPVTQPRCTTTECSADFTNGVAVWSKLRGTQFTPYTQIPQVPVDPNAKNNLLGGSLR